MQWTEVQHENTTEISHKCNKQHRASTYAFVDFIRNVCFNSLNAIMVVTLAFNELRKSKFPCNLTDFLVFQDKLIPFEILGKTNHNWLENHLDKILHHYQPTSLSYSTYANPLDFPDRFVTIRTCFNFPHCNMRNMVINRRQENS